MLRTSQYHERCVPGRRQVMLICPGCKQSFTLKPTIFAARKRASKTGVLYCSLTCANASHARWAQTPEAQRRKVALRAAAAGGA